HPENAVIVRRGRDQVIAPIAVDVEHVDEPRRAKIKFGMPGPFSRARILRRFEPTFRGNDVVTAVSVYVARSDSMTVARIADDMLYKFAALCLEPGERGLRISKLG